MPNQNQKIFDDLRDQIRSKIKDAFSKKLMKDLGKEMADRIRVRTRTGKGVDSMGADAKPLKRLKDSYRKVRKNSPDLNRSLTSNVKSNLTFTGQLLDSIQGDAINERQFIITLKENRNDGIKNADLTRWQEEKGRKFFYFSRAEIKAIYNKINQFLRKELKL